ncbi:MAG TPA: class I SAM-dependent methyltransferase [Spirochaetia bacterium]|nr:class I SAM-dependent methyltransferase [Spirochaetia bacterium]
MKTYTSAPARQHERTKQIECPLCGPASSAPYLALPGCLYVRCSGCGLVYQNPQPVFEDLRGRYDKDYFHYEIENEDNFYQLMRLGLNDIGFDDAFLAAAEDKSFLDIGCATGKLLGSMKDLGFNVQGVEICAQSAAYGMATRGVPIFIGTLEEAAFLDDSFSFIHFSHLIEHVPDPLGFLREVRRVLRKDGAVIVTTPNIDGLQARLFKAAWRSAIPDHLFLFSRITLEMLLVKAGFTVEQSVTWGGLARGTVPGWLKKPVDLLAKQFGFGDVMLLLARVRADQPASRS